jgi:hypothetical protein
VHAVEQTDEITASAVVPFQRSRIENLNPRNACARDGRCQTGTHDLNLGQFGHER